MELPIDYKIDRLLNEIKVEVKKELGVDVPIEVIKSVVEQQALSTAEGFKNGHTSVWKYFGTFVATKKNVDTLNKRYAKIGLSPTLIDNGLLRVSFTKSGDKLNVIEFEGQSKKDELHPDDYFKKDRVA